MYIEHQFKTVQNKHCAKKNNTKQLCLPTYQLLISIGKVKAPSYHCYLSRNSQYWRINSAARHRNDPLLTKPSARINSLSIILSDNPIFLLLTLFCPPLTPTENRHWRSSHTVIRLLSAMFGVFVGEQWRAKLGGVTLCSRSFIQLLQSSFWKK